MATATTRSALPRPAGAPAITPRAALLREILRETERLLAQQRAAALPSPGSQGESPAPAGNIASNLSQEEGSILEP